MVRTLLLSLVFCILANGVQAAPDPSQASDDALIDSLTTIDGPVMGADGLSQYSGFILDGVEYNGGVLGAPAASTPPATLELVRRGVAALPDLIAHLTDKRPTKLVVGGEFYMFQYFSTEYDPRERRHRNLLCGGGCEERPFDGTYTVRVGDICYFLVGQIVGRYLTAVRYQPSAGLVVNSPLESPELVAAIHHDWAAVSADSFREFLLADIEGARNLIRAGPALARLRFYYPDSYRGLTGVSADWRGKFEAEEKRELAARPGH
jgi:hypothetical protein